MHCVSKPSSFIFFVVFQQQVFFPEGMEVQSRNFVHINQLDVSVFSIALCFFMYSVLSAAVLSPVD